MVSEYNKRLKHFEYKTQVGYTSLNEKAQNSNFLKYHIGTKKKKNDSNLYCFASSQHMVNSI